MVARSTGAAARIMRQSRHDRAAYGV